MGFCRVVKTYKWSACAIFLGGRRRLVLFESDTPTSIEVAHATEPQLLGEAPQKHFVVQINSMEVFSKKRNAYVDLC